MLRFNVGPVLTMYPCMLEEGHPHEPTKKMDRMIYEC